MLSIKLIFVEGRQYFHVRRVAHQFSGVWLVHHAERICVYLIEARSNQRQNRVQIVETNVGTPEDRTREIVQAGVLANLVHNVILRPETDHQSSNGAEHAG